MYTSVHSYLALQSADPCKPNADLANVTVAGTTAIAYSLKVPELHKGFSACDTACESTCRGSQHSPASVHSDCSLDSPIHRQTKRSKFTRRRVLYSSSSEDSDGDNKPPNSTLSRAGLQAAPALKTVVSNADASAGSREQEVNSADLSVVFEHLDLHRLGVEAGLEQANAESCNDGSNPHGELQSRLAEMSLLDHNVPCSRKTGLAVAQEPQV